jgi:molybdenum cofactor biosynthesis enzyme
LTCGIVDYAVLVSSKNPVKRISAALGALDVADGPMSRLEAARRLREAAEELEAAQVEAARKAGATWIEIGACYGLTKQGAQQRFRTARNQAKAAAAAPGAVRSGTGAGGGPTVSPSAAR